MLRLLLPFIIAGLGAPQIAAAQEMRELVPMVFFVAKGKADSCGTGCDTWIAAHGNFDLGSARRFAVFLKKLGKRDLPIIFHSGGGSTIQAMAIGKLIRARKMAVNVGYTVPLDCGGYATSDKCKRDVNSGRELESILTAAGDCASSCVFALIGGSRRELSERAQVRIHSYKFFSTKGGKHRMATPAKRAAPLMAKFDVEAERYIHDMGASRELFTTIRSVPYEQMRTLTRNEIVRFGIDTRKFPSVNLPMAGPIKLFDVQERAMTFFIAKGGPNSCGPGCDTWIAAHGLLDPTALIRFRNFLEMIGPSDLPMFIHSVEGSFTQAISIGGLARDRKMRIGVGLTVPLECKGAASSEECDRIRTGGGELKSVLRTDAVCGPACFYLLLGGARREVADDAVLQVRPVKVYSTSKGQITGNEVATEAARIRERETVVLLEAFVEKMGFDKNLVTLAEGVEGRGTRTLRRDEIVSFGIDQRTTAVVPTR